MTAITHDQLKAFARVVGWKLASAATNAGLSNPWWIDPNGKTRKLPDFLNDKNALFEALRNITPVYSLHQLSTCCSVVLYFANNTVRGEGETCNIACSEGDTINIACILAVLTAKEKA